MASSDLRSPPSAARIFASKWGQYGFLLRVAYRDHKIARVSGKLFTYHRKTGEERIVWDRRLACAPRRVIVSDFGTVIALDDSARNGHHHSLVVFDRSGNIIADYTLDDLLTAQEIQAHAKVKGVHRSWDVDTVARFTREQLTLMLGWGKQILVNLKTGELSKE